MAEPGQQVQRRVRQVRRQPAAVARGRVGVALAVPEGHRAADVRDVEGPPTERPAPRRRGSRRGRAAPPERRRRGRTRLRCASSSRSSAGRPLVQRAARAASSGSSGVHPRPVRQEVGPHGLDVVLDATVGQRGVPTLAVRVEVVAGPGRVHARSLARGRHQGGGVDPVGMVGRAGQRVRAADRHAEQPESVYPQPVSEREGVVGDAPVRRRGRCGSAVAGPVGGDQADAEPARRVVTAPGRAAGVGAAVEEQHRAAEGISHLGPGQDAAVAQFGERHLVTRWRTGAAPRPSVRARPQCATAGRPTLRPGAGGRPRRPGGRR